MILKKSVPFSEFLRLRKIVRVTISAGITNAFVFSLPVEGLPHEVIQQAWEKTSKTARRQLLLPKSSNINIETPIMFITTYNRTNPNFKEILSRS